MDPSELAAIPVAKDSREQPWAMLGIEYEDRVVKRLGRETNVIAPPKGEGLLERQAVAFLRGEGPANYAAQVNLKPRTKPDFIGSEDVVLRRSFVDLIRRETRDGALYFTLIDIKATRQARAFHKTQVAYYVLLLRAVLRELGVKATVEAKGEIWHIPADGTAEGDAWSIDAFDLKPYERLVEDFCRTTLPAIASKIVSPDRDESFFHVYFKCEQCAYLPHCIDAVGPGRAPARRDVSAVAGLSHEAKRTLRSIGVGSVAALADLGAGVGQIDGAGWSLSRRADQLVARARALRDGLIQQGTEPHTFLMPPRADAAIYLVADTDPVDANLVTLGYRYVDAKGAREQIEVMETADPTAEADALVRIFSALVADLEAIDVHNAAIGNPADPANIYAHIFIYEPTEALALQDAVKRHLDDPRVRTGLLHMVRLFPPDEVVPEPEFRGMQHLPATALRSVVEQLFAMPVTVSYDLRQVTGALRAAGHIPHAYEPAQGFARPFSALLALDISRGLREQSSDAPDAAAIRADVAARLAAIQAISEWLRGEHRRRVDEGAAPMLRLNKQPFRLQASFNPLAAGDLDILRAFEMLENRAGLLDTMIRLAQAKKVRRDTGRAVGPMRLLNLSDKGKSAYLLFALPAGGEDADLAAGAMGLILSNGEPEYILEPRSWRYLGCDLLDPLPGDRANLLRVRIFGPNLKSAIFREAKLSAGEDQWWLDQSFVDYNSEKADAFLSFLGEGAEG